uniref:Putative prohead protease n=1 Tax=viral metagenome TaxID=1070528 RepID=A0A6M3KIE5_9ZZZZ
MVKIIYKIIEDCEVKKIGERQYEFTASTSDVDRDGEVIDAGGWDLKNFKKNPVIMFAHDYRTLPIGKAPRVWVSSKDGVKSLKNTIQFPPEGTYEFADIVERLVDTGYLTAESVGFIPREWDEGDGEKSPRRTYTKQELLEISIVPVPSNPNALRNAVDEGIITTKQFETITETEEHKPEPKKTSQEQIIDELDYLIRLIDTEGMNDDAQKDAWQLVREVIRISGSDIPVDIKELILPTEKEVETKPDEPITYQEIQEAIKRIANKTEVN